MSMAARAGAPIDKILDQLRDGGFVPVRYGSVTRTDGSVAPLYHDSETAEIENAIEQAVHVCKSTVVQDAWARNQALAIHAVVYGLDDGRLRDLGFSVASARDLRSGLVTALNAVPQLR